MYTLTALLSIGCFLAIGAAIEHRVWLLIPILALGGVVFFLAAPEED